MKTKAYSYLRLSTEVQAHGSGRDRQLDLSQKYAADNDLELIDEIKDIGVSAFQGQNAKTGHLSRFLKLIEDGEIPRGSVLLVESLDRLSRESLITAFNLFTRILAAGITIVTLIDNQTYTSESISENIGQLFISLGVMLRANEESKTKSRRLKAAWVSKRGNINTKKLTSHVPSWLELNKESGQILIKESKAQIVQRIFKLCIEGKGMYVITRELNQNLSAYPPIGRAAHWHQSYVSKILHNPSTYGFYQPCVILEGKRTSEGEAIEDYYPAVISKETFLLARASIKQRHVKGGGRKSKANANIFSKLLICGSCNRSIGYQNKGKLPKNKYLRCLNSADHYKCKSPSWQYDEFESCFFRFIREVDLSEALRTDEYQSESVNLRHQHDSNVATIVDLKLAQETLADRIQSPELPEGLINEFGKRYEKNSIAIKELEENNVDIMQLLSELDVPNTEVEQLEMLAAMKNLASSTEDEQSAHVRLKVNTQMRKIIHHIKLFNPGYLVDPFNAKELICKKLKKELEDRGMKTQEQLFEFFRTTLGEDLYRESERYFAIYFRTGEIRVVYPYQERSVKHTPLLRQITEQRLKRMEDQDRKQKVVIN